MSEGSVEIKDLVKTYVDDRGPPATSLNYCRAVMTAWIGSLCAPIFGWVKLVLK